MEGSQHSQGSQQFSFQSSILKLGFWLFGGQFGRTKIIFRLGGGWVFIEDCSSSLGKYIPSSKRADDGFKLKMEVEIAFIYADAAFRSSDKKASYGYSIWFSGSLLFAGSLDGPNAPSSKQVEARAILFAMREARTRGFSKAMIGQSTLFCMTSKGLAYPMASQWNWL